MEQIPKQDFQQPSQPYQYQQDNAVRNSGSNSWITEDISEPTSKIYQTGNTIGKIGIILVIACAAVMFILSIFFPGFHSSANGEIDAFIAWIGVLAGIGLPIGIILVVISRVTNTARTAEIGFDLTKRLINRDLPYRLDILVLDTDDFVIDVGGLRTDEPQEQITMLFSYLPAGVSVGKKVAVKNSHFSEYLFGYCVKILNIEPDSQGYGYRVTVIQPAFEEMFDR